MNKDTSKNKGYTLIELLAIIAVLSIIVTLTFYTFTNIVNNAKQKSYKVTINNVEDEAINYITERLSSSTWNKVASSNLEYQCVSVQNLIDAGYFKSDVLDSYISDNRKVLASDNIYLERNITSKTITKKLLILNGSYNGICRNIKPLGDIYFDVNPSGWSKSKNISIKYRLHNISYVTDYNYAYSFDISSIQRQFDSPEENTSLVATNNGNLYAMIKDKNDNIITSSTLNIDKIDNINPSGEINIINNKSITLTMIDNESGVSKYYFGKDNPEELDVDWNDIEPTKNYSKNLNIASEGTWYLAIEDYVGNKYITNKFIELPKKYTISYYPNGGTGTINSHECTYGNNCQIKNNSFTKSDYTFAGWTTNSDGTDDGYNWTNWNGIWTFENGQKGISNNKLTLYARWNKLHAVKINYNVSGGTVKEITGSNRWNANSSGIIELNNKVFETTLKYGESLSTSGLPDANNQSYINITKTGYTAKRNAQWICLSDNCKGKIFDEQKVYSSNDFCNASTNDCTVTLGVNWNANTYTITYYANGGYAPVANSNSQYCTYNSNGNHDIDGAMTTQTCTYGKSCTLNINQYTRQCHLFKGWTTKSDTDSTDYTAYDMNASDTDEFYANGDTFTYNIANNIKLYAIWKSNHKFNATGNQLHITSGYFHSCYKEHDTGEHPGAYSIYCSECQMSARHYNLCYKPQYQTREYTQYCPCCRNSNITKTYDDHQKFNPTGSNIEYIRNDKLSKFGGIIENQSMPIVGNGQLYQKVCEIHSQDAC